MDGCIKDMWKDAGGGIANHPAGRETTYTIGQKDLARFLMAFQANRPDPGTAMVEEFHNAFECVITRTPWMPELSEQDKLLVKSYMARLLGMATQLKADAASANMAGRSALGLLLVRLQLHVEENGELAEAWVDQDLVAALDALTDISYVVDGTYLTMGLNQVKPAADREVHRSNMSKLGADGKPMIHPSGRVIKGPNYSPPDLAAVLAPHLQP